MDYFCERGFNCAALSLRGHGNSEGGRSLRWFSLRDYVSDVHRVASAFSDPPIIVGHSMGAVVLQKYLEVHDAAGGVLLAPPPPWGVIWTALRFAIRHPWVFLKTNLTLNMQHIVGTAALAREMFFSADIQQERLQYLFQKLQGDSYRAYLDMLLFALPKVRKISSPMLVLGAENDEVFRKDEVISTGKALGTKSEFFEGMGHDMMLEDGWQLVAQRITHWVEARSGSLAR